jgi:hypothetical protein
LSAGAPSLIPSLTCNRAGLVNGAAMRLTIKHCVAAMPEIFLVKVSAITREDVVALADVAYRMSGRRVTDASVCA